MGKVSDYFWYDTALIKGEKMGHDFRRGDGCRYCGVNVMWAEEECRGEEANPMAEPEYFEER